MSELRSFLVQDCEGATSTETIDVVVPIRIVNSQTPAVIEGSEESHASNKSISISYEFCNALFAFNETSNPGPLRIANATSISYDDEPTYAVTFDSPCFKASLLKNTPVLCQLTAHRQEQNVSVLDIKQPQFLLPPPQTTPAATHQLSSRDFEISGVLGAGAFGTVCAARYKGNGGGVALKVIKKRVGEGKNPVTQDVFGPLGLVGMGSADVKNRNMVVTEWLIMQRLAGIEGVVEILGSCHDSNNFYIAMASFVFSLMSENVAYRFFLALVHRRYIAFATCPMWWSVLY